MSFKIISLYQKLILKMKCKLNKKKKKEVSLECNYRKYFRLHWLNFPTTRMLKFLKRLNVGNQRYRGNGMSVFRDKF